MENASKALIIAGAILISILLISVGIILINSGKNVVSQGDAGMQSYQIQTFNGEFTAFEGDIKGSQVRNIVSKVNASNATDDAHQVTVISTANGITTVPGFQASRTYTVTLRYATGNGDTLTNTSILAGPTSVTTERGYIYSIEIGD